MKEVASVKTILKFEKRREAAEMQKKLYQSGLQCEVDEKHPKRVTIWAENPGLQITTSLLELGINPSHMKEKTVEEKEEERG